MGEVKCRSCGAPIIWIVDQNGTRLPLNKTRVRIYSVDPAGEGWLVEEVLTGKPKLNYISHFLTCPSASKHSTRGAGGDR